MLRKTRLSLGVATVGAMFAAVLAPSTAAFAAPSFSATPSSSLYEGAVVAVSGSGLAPNEVVFLVECNASVQAADYCDTGHVKQVTADSSGALPSGTTFTVHSGKIGSNAAAVCSFSTNGQCVIAVADAQTQQPLGGIPITFSEVLATPRTNLLNNQTVTVTGRGLPANTTMALVECFVPIGGTTGCNLGNLKTVTTDASGNMPATAYKVTTGKQGSDATSICNSTTNGRCAIAVGDVATGTAFGGAAISFAATPSLNAVASRTTVPTGKAFNIHGRTKVGSRGVNGLTVALYKRLNAKHGWTKVTSMKTRTISGVKGSYKFALKGLSHSEQYQVRHPKQTIASLVYTAVRSKVVTIKH